MLTPEPNWRRTTRRLRKQLPRSELTARNLGLAAQLRKDAEAAVGKAEAELQRKLGVLRWHQRLEIKGLLTK